MVWGSPNVARNTTSALRRIIDSRTSLEASQSSRINHTALKLRRPDILFSRYIRNRDRWTCRRCGTRYELPTNGLHCSHYWGRAREATRFEPDNADALCFGCHRIWGHGDGRDEYKAFKIKQLGEKRFKTLMLQANAFQKKDDKLMTLFVKGLLKTQVNDP